MQAKAHSSKLRIIARVLGLTGVALIALIGGVFLHLDTKLGRRLLVANLAPLLANTFRGKIVIDRLDSIGPFRASGVDARVLDERGALVASLNDASVTLDTLTLLRSGIRTISLPSIHARHAEVVLLESPSGSLTLVESFEPKTPSPPSSEPAPDVRLPRIRIDHVWTHGKLTGLDSIDAEATHLDGSFEYVSEQVVLDVRRVGIVARSLPKRLDPDGTVSAKLTVPPKAPLFASATFDGSVNSVPVWIDAGWKNEALTAAVDIPRASAAELRRVSKDLGADLDIREPGGLSLRAQGRLDAISAHTRVSLGSAKIDISARGSLAPDLDLNAVASVNDFDAHSMGKDLAPTRVNARASSRIRIVKGEPVIGFTAAVEPFVWDGNDIPATRATGTFVSNTLTVDARAAEPGAPVDATLVLRGETLDFHLEVESRNLAAIRRLNTGASGSARVSATGSYRIDHERLDAVVSVSGSGLAYQGQKVRHLDARGRLQGPVQRLSGDVKVEARRLSLDGRDFASAVVEARGSVDAFQSRVVIDGETAPDATATFSGSVGERIQFTNVLLDLDRRDVHAKISADAISVDGSNIEARNVIVTGPGSLTASGRWKNGELSLVADAKGLDVTELARIVDVELPVSGYLNLQADVAITSRAARGTVSLSARSMKFDDVENATLDGTLALEGRTLTGKFQVQHRALDARLVVKKIELGGTRPLTDIATWKAAVGEVELKARGRIIQLRRIVNVDAIERYKPTGRIDVAAKLSRQDPDAIPDLELTVATRRLQLSDPDPKQTKRRAFLTAGNNLACSASIIGNTRSTDLACVVTGQKQTLVEVRLRTILPMLAVWRDRAALLARVEDTPIQARAVVVERPIEEWPSVVRPKSFAGRIGATMTMDGTLTEPNLNLSVWAQNVVEERLGQKVAARVDVKYDGKQADFRLNAKHGARAALTGDGAVRFSLVKLLHSEPQKPEVDAHAKLDRLELASIPFLKDNRIEGRLSGKLDADHLGTDDPRIAGRLDFERLLVGNARIERGTARLDLDTQKLVATVQLHQRDGSVRAELNAVPIWKGFAPGIDPEKRMTAKLLAKKLSASILLPALRDSVSDIDGRIDADLEVDLQRGRNQVRGYARLQNGELQVPAIGQALDHVNVYVAAEPGGLLRMREASLKGVSGKVRASGWAKLDGFALSRAWLGARIREKEKLPLTLEGVLIGDVWGGVDIAVETKKQELAVDVNVRSLHLELPPKKENTVQSLDPDPHVRIGVQRRRKGFILLPVQPIDDEPSEPVQLVARLNLGNDIWIERGPELSVRLGGELVYRNAPEGRMTGQIRIARGKLDVQGKLFEIREGTVTFQGNPTNPIVVATATWESPEGIVVYADYRGPVEGGKLTLHAEPALTRDQIVSLLLFGSPDGSFGSGGGSGAGAAASVGGGVATKGLNRAMDDLTSLDVSTRIDTSEAGSPRPELVWQLTPRVSAQLGYNVEAPAPGKSPDRTLLTLEFRLFRRWLLASTFGDRGSTLFDLLWRYRY